MAVVAQMTCDICQRAKRDGEGQWICAWTWPQRPRCIVFGPAGMAPLTGDGNQEHVCGEACAQIRLSRALSTEVKEEQ